MRRLRSFVARYPVAAGAACTLVIAAAGWSLFAGFVRATQDAGRQTGAALRTMASVPSAARRAASAGDRVAAAANRAASAVDRAGSSANVPAGGAVASEAQAARPQGAAGRTSAGEAAVTRGQRSDPFASAVSNAGAARDAGETLPPVPPLLPGQAPPGGRGAPGTDDAGAAGPPAAPSYRVTGILGGSVALAILADAHGTRIAGVGDVLGPGVRVVAIDASRGVVELVRDGLPLEVRLGGGPGR